MEAVRQVYQDSPQTLEYLRTEFFTQPDDILAIWEVQGQPVSALRLERYQDGLLLEGLETAPNHRRQGHAAALIRAVLASLNPGTQVYAHVDKKNKVSLRTHAVCGFQLLKDSASFVDGTISARAVTLCRKAENSS